MATHSVRLPDGTVIENVPEGTTQAELLQILKGKGYDVPQAWAAQGPAGAVSPRKRYTEAELDPMAGVPEWDKFLAGMGRAPVEAARGARDIARDIYAGPRGVFGLPPTEQVFQTPEQERRVRALDEPLMATTAGQAGNIAGNVMTYAPMAMLPGANTIAGSALYGAAAGGLTMPAEDWSERARNASIAGLTSGAISAAPSALRLGYQGLVKPFMQGGRNELALSAIERAAQDPNWQNAITAGASEVLPGSRKTLAEVTQDPGIARLQRGAMASSEDMKNTMAERSSERFTARRNALLQMGTDEDMAYYTAARDATAERLYGEARAAGVDAAKAKELAPEIKELLARPSIKRARADAIEKAREAGETLTPKEVSGGSLDGLHYMKMALDDEIGAAKRTGSDNEVRLLMNTKDKLVGLMQKLSPRYAKAMAEYEAGSKPINQIQVSNYLYKKLFPALSDVGGEKTNVNAFLEAVREGDKMAQKATGFKGAKLTDILTPEQMRTILNMVEDVGGEAKTATQAKAGAPISSKYLTGSNLMESIMGALGIPKSWSEAFSKTTIGKTVAAVPSALGTVAEQDVQATLAKMLTDPEFAAAVRTKSILNRARLAPVQNAMRYGVPATAIGVGISETGR